MKLQAFILRPQGLVHLKDHKSVGAICGQWYCDQDVHWYLGYVVVTCLRCVGTVRV